MLQERPPPCLVADALRVLQVLNNVGLREQKAGPRRTKVRSFRDHLRHHRHNRLGVFSVSELSATRKEQFEQVTGEIVLFPCFQNAGENAAGGKADLLAQIGGTPLRKLEVTRPQDTALMSVQEHQTPFGRAVC